MLLVIEFTCTDKIYSWADNIVGNLKGEWVSDLNISLDGAKSYQGKIKEYILHHRVNVSY